MIRHSRLLSFVTGIVLAGGTASPSVVSAASCFSKGELEASHVRQLQTEFMVAALTCEKHPTVDLVGKYNAFVKKYQKELGGNAKELKGHFARNYGGSQSKVFDSYMTTLANDASTRGKQSPVFCELTDQKIDKALVLRNNNLQPFASTTVASYSVAEPCKGVVASTAYAAPQLAVAKTSPASASKKATASAKKKPAVKVAKK